MKTFFVVIKWMTYMLATPTKEKMKAWKPIFSTYNVWNKTYHIKNKCLHHEKPKNKHMTVLCLIKFYKI